MVVNKIDRMDARPEEVVDLTFDLMAELGASDEQLDFPILYAVAREGGRSGISTSRGVTCGSYSRRCWKRYPPPK